MRINYNVTGSDRKKLVVAISQELGVSAKYLAAPTFGYEIGGYNIDRNGMLTGKDNHDLVANLESLHDLKAISEEYDTSIAETQETPDFEDLKLTAEEELGLGKQRREDAQGENAESLCGRIQASDVPEVDTLEISLPREGFSETALTNLERLIESKSSLIKKALGADSLPIEIADETISFPWFTVPLDGETVTAYTKFIAALCEMAKTQKRITATEKSVDNEKYAFRCFLLRLGFIGNEYKVDRKVLLSRLEGNGAFKAVVTEYA